MLYKTGNLSLIQYKKTEVSVFMIIPNDWQNIVITPGIKTSITSQDEIRLTMNTAHSVMQSLCHSMQALIKIQNKEF